MIDTLARSLSRGVSRVETLAYLKDRRAIVSVHEHVGKEILLCADQGRVAYEQTLEEYRASTSHLSWATLGLISTTRGAVFCPMPAYERFGVPTESRDSDGDLYWRRNVCLSAACIEAQEAARMRMGAEHVWPIAFLFVDPAQKAAVFEARYESLLDRVGGFKWHPFAQCTTPAQFVDQGYLELAAERNLPTLIHCTRPGVAGDLRDILDTVARRACCVRAAICVAHGGFLHPDLAELRDYDFLYVDSAPWSLICDGGHIVKQHDVRLERLVSLCEDFSKQILFGFDTPWSRIKQPDGTCSGASISDDFGMLQQACRRIGTQMATGWLHDNPLRYLSGRRWTA